MNNCESDGCDDGAEDAFRPVPLVEAPSRGLPHGKYDPRIEFVLMRNGRRLGVEYRRFIQGKLALTGFVEEPGDPAHDGKTAAGGEFRRCGARGIAKARLRRIARLALEAAAENT